MNVDLPALQIARALPGLSSVGTPEVEAATSLVARSLVARSLLAQALSTPAFVARLGMTLVVGMALLGAPASFAQDAALPPKVKASKPKALAKPKEAAPDEDGEQKAQATPVKRDPAQAQRTFDGGVKLLQAGKAEPAVQSFSSVISGGNVPPQLMARALHQRGAAYRLAGKPAQAVSDLTSALWLKSGLSETERADAIQQRAAAYREAGLPDQSDPGDGKASAKRTATTPAAVGASSAPNAAAAVTTASLAPEPASPAKSASSPLGNLFGNWFGSASSNQSASVAPAAAPAPPQQPSTSAWSSATTTAPVAAAKSARVASAAVVAPQPVAAAVTPAKAVATGTAHARMIQSSEADASKLAGRLQGEFSSQLGGRAPEVSKAQFGGMGAFFQVRVGPYKTPAEAQAFCSRIKATGADCVAVTQ